MVQPANPIGESLNYGDTPVTEDKVMVQLESPTGESLTYGDTSATEDNEMVQLDHKSTHPD